MFFFCVTCALHLLLVTFITCSLIKNKKTKQKNNNNPAQKVAGFLGHSAAYGCSKCLKKFSGGFGSKDYSGFDRSLWPARSNNAHRAAIEDINNKPNKTQRNQAESKYGCRYSSLLKLEYFDPVRMVVVDPMHNLFLGSAKHLMKVLWSKHDIISEAMLLQMQDVTNSFE